jgi:O-antigen/teichoic acid export membrane protein
MSFTRRFSLFLIPTIWRSVFSLMILPFTTYRLDAADFGIFAMVTGISSYLTALATGGIGYILHAQYAGAGPDERRRLVTTLAFWSFVIGLALAGAMVVTWSSLVYWLGDGAQVSTEAVWYGAAHVILGVPWVLAITVAAITGRAGIFAIVSLAETTLGPLATLLVLYGLDWDGTSLFAGNVVSTAVTAIGAFWLLRSDLSLRISRSLTRDYFRHLVVTLPAQLVERFRSAAERVLLARYTGLEMVGIFVHSQQYATLGRFGLKALSQAIWSTSLVEAKEPSRRFTKTGQGWTLAHFATALGGIAVTAFSQDFIALLTHGKFTNAYVFASVWIILILLENTGKPMTAILFANKRAAINQNLLLSSALAGLAVLFVATPLWGGWGLVAGTFAQTLGYRLGLRLVARREGNVPFQDWVAVWGMLVVAVLLGILVVFKPTLGERALLALGAVIVLTMLCARSLREIVTTLRDMLVRDRKPS